MFTVRSWRAQIIRASIMHQHISMSGTSANYTPFVHCARARGNPAVKVAAFTRPAISKNTTRYKLVPDKTAGLFAGSDEFGTMFFREL
jgi:hypothetical protein